MPNYNSIHTGNAIDTAVTGVASKAPLVHTHLIADVTDAATVASTGSYNDLTDKPTLGTASALNVPATGDALATEVVKGNDSRLTNARTPLAHTHAILDVSGLQTVLDGKASSVHSHVIGDVTGLQTALDGKSDTSHTHTGVYEPANANIQSHISATNNPHGTTAIQVGAYTTSQVDTLLSGKADAVHNHNDLYYTESEVDTLLDGKANTTHTHAISNVTGLQSALDGKQPTGSYLTTSAIGTTVQAYDADLTDWAGVSTTAKQDTLVSGTNIKTINSQSILGSGDLTITAGASALDDLTDVTITTPATGEVLSYNGSAWVNATASGGSSPTLTIDNKTAAYTVVDGDLGKIINCTSGTFTVSLTAAATLGAGFNVTVWNTSTTSSHVITIDPNGSELVDGVATLLLSRGEGLQLVCDGANWQVGDKKTMRGYAENIVRQFASYPLASGENAIAIGTTASATGGSSIAMSTGGGFAQATNTGAIALGKASASGLGSIGIGTTSNGATLVESTGNYTTAFATNSSGGGSKAVTGSGAMALGGSYASGTDSFAAAIGNNTSSYGATGANSVAIGKLVKASGINAIAIGSSFTVASASSAIALGKAEATAVDSISICASTDNYRGTSNGTGAISIGWGRSSSSYPIASGQGSFAIQHGRAREQGKLVFAYDMSGWEGQYGLLTPKGQTTDATPKVLTSNNSTASTTNQVILPNNSTYAFTGTIVAQQSKAQGSATAAWKVEGLITRGANAAATTLVASTVTAISNAPAWTIALSADTTNGGLAVTATGAAATNIRWVATIETTEVTYA
jgi:hypothetical protein